MNENSNPDEHFEDELVRLHEKLAIEKHPDSHRDLNTDRDSSSELPERLQSAWKVMELLSRTKPNRNIDCEPTIAGGRLSETAKDKKVDSQIEDKTIPSTIGRFEIRSVLGKGGFGIVFLAIDPDLNREVAIKVPQLNSLLDADAQTRFLREGQALAHLNHPNIVPVFEVGNDGPIAYITSEYVPGINLAELIRQRDEPLGEKIAARLVAEVADAIQHAHARGVIHRDIKPANILVQMDGEIATEMNDGKDYVVRVTDFGLAKLINESDPGVTRTGSLIGTPAFGAPEQLQSDGFSETTAAADIYSLGAVLYFLLTGRAPFVSDSIMQTIADVQNTAPISPQEINENVSNDLSAICLKCLEKTPSDRYPTAHELQQDLNRFLNGEPVLARPLTGPQRLWRWCKRNRTVAALSLFAMTTVLTALIVISGLLFRSENLRADAEQARARSNAKAIQLTDTIERLFTAVAESPTIRLGDAAPLRERLLNEANVLYDQILVDEPENDQLELERLRSIYRLAKLNQVLGNPRRALEFVEICLIDAKRFHQNGLIDSAEFLAWYSFAAQQLNDLGRFEDADHQYTTAFGFLQIDPEEYDGHATTEEEIAFASYVANVLSRRASLLFESSEVERADSVSTKAVQIWSQIPVDAIERNTGSQFYKATCLLVRGKILEQKGAFKQSEENMIEAVELIRPLASDPLIKRLAEKERLAQCLLQLGLSVAQQNRLSEARGWYLESIDVLSELVELNPRVVRYPQLLSSVRYSLAVTEMLSEEYEQAEDLVLENIRQLESILQNENELSQSYVKQLANNFNILSVIRIRSPDRTLESAAEAVTNSIQFLESAVESRPDWLQLKLDLGRATHNLADIQLANGNESDAIENYEFAIKENENVVRSQPTWGQARHALASTHLSFTYALAESGELEQALQHSRLAIEFFDGKDFRPQIDEARLRACLGEVEAGYDTLEKFIELIEQDAGDYQQFIYVASRAAKVHHYLSENDPPADSQLPNDLSFDELALRSLKSGLKLTEPNHDKFFEIAEQAPELAELIKQLKAGTITDK